MKMSHNNQILSIPMKISIDNELNEFYKEICDLRAKNQVDKTENVLYERLASLCEVFEKTTLNVNKTCHYLNDSTDGIFKRRLSEGVISVGKNSAPLIVSLKQVGDDIYRNDIGINVNMEEIIQDSLSKVEGNIQVLEDMLKSTYKFAECFGFLIESLRNQNRNRSTEISNLLDKDVITSSPINILKKPKVN